MLHCALLSKSYRASQRQAKVRRAGVLQAGNSVLPLRPQTARSLSDSDRHKPSVVDRRSL